MRGCNTQTALALARLHQPRGHQLRPGLRYEIAVIVKDGLRRMYGERPEDVFYYLTVYNEPKLQPAMPTLPSLEEGILRGLYRFRQAQPGAAGPRIQLLSSGTAIHWALKARSSCQMSGGFMQTSGPSRHGRNCGVTLWTPTGHGCAARSGPLT